MFILFLRISSSMYTTSIFVFPPPVSLLVSLMTFGVSGRLRASPGVCSFGPEPSLVLVACGTRPAASESDPHPALHPPNGSLSKTLVYKNNHVQSETEFVSIRWEKYFSMQHSTVNLTKSLFSNRSILFVLSLRSGYR